MFEGFAGRDDKGNPNYANTSAADPLAFDVAFTKDYRGIRFNVAGIVVCNFAKSDGTIDTARAMTVAAGETPPFTVGPHGAIRQLVSAGSDAGIVSSLIQGLL